MIKQLGILLLFVTSFSSIAQALRYDDWIVKPARHNYSKMLVWRYNLNKIKVRDTSFISGNAQFEDTTLFSTEYFDQAGRTTKKAGYNGYHYSYEISRYEYDSLGRIIEIKNLRSDSTERSVRVSQFDDSSKNILQKEYLRGELIKFSEIQYTVKGVFLSDQLFWADSLLEFSRSNSLNTDTLKIIKAFEGDSELSEFLIYRFDKQFQMVESSIFNRDSSFSQGSFYRYDSVGNVISEKWIVDDGEIREEIMYKYDKDGELLKKITFESGILYSVTEYEGGVLRTEEIYNANGIATTLFVYEYE